MGKWREYRVGEYRLGQLNGEACAVWYTDGKRSRYRLGVRDEASARLAVERFARAKKSLAVKSLTSVDEIFAAWKADLHAEGKDSHDNIEVRRQALRATFGALRPADIDKALCKRYAEDVRAGKAAWTVFGELSYLSNCMSWAVKNGIIEKMPRLWIPPRPEPKDYHISREDAERLISAAASHHIRLFIILAISTAARKTALLELTWARVDFASGTIQLRVPGQMHKKGRATVPINRTAMLALREARKGALTDHVIEFNGQPVADIKKGFARAAQRAELPDVTPHVLRHSAAVWMAEAGRSIDEIAQYLGHKDSRITYRVYARFSPNFMQGAADALEINLVRAVK